MSMAPARQADVAESVASATWAGPVPRIAALVSTYRRPEFLRELLGALESQDLAPEEYEVIIVDNGSGDGTWAELIELSTATPARLLAVRVSENQGPGPGRNAGAEHVRAPVIAITDDDCLPTSTWLAEVAAAFERDPELEVTQGAVHADPRAADHMGPWDHTKWIMVPTPFFETCNVAYRRMAFERVGGFDGSDPLLNPRSGRAFGEDACLAWSVVRSGGGSAFLDAAVVHHRCIEVPFGRWLRDIAHVHGFPGLARRSGLVDRWLWSRVFLSRTTAEFDLALVGVAATVLSRRRVWPALLALPWLRRRAREARNAAGGDRLELIRVLAGYGIGDLVMCARLAQGSVRYRKLVL